MLKVFTIYGLGCLLGHVTTDQDAINTLLFPLKKVVSKGWCKQSSNLLISKY